MSLVDDMQEIMARQYAGDRFGEDVVFTPSEGAAVTVRGAFAESFEAVDPETYAMVRVTQPRVQIVRADLPEDVEDMAVTVRGEVFQVADVQRRPVLVDILLHRQGA